MASRGGCGKLAAFFAKRCISKSKTYFWTLSPLTGVSFILLRWDVNLKVWDKCLYSKFGMLKRSAERPKSPTSGVIWPGEWDCLADLLFWGRKLMLWTSKLPPQQWRLSARILLGWLRVGFSFERFDSVLVRINLTFPWPALTSISLCIILNYALALLFYVIIYVFSLRHITCNWWKGIFWKPMGWSIVF